MTVTATGTLVRGSQRSEMATEYGTQAAPAMYATGGFNIALGLTQTPVDFQVWCNDSRLGATADLQWALVVTTVTVSGLPQLNVKVYTMTTAGAGPNAWAELTNTSAALNGLTFLYRATAPGGA